MWRLHHMQAAAPTRSHIPCCAPAAPLARLASDAPPPRPRRRPPPPRVVQVGSEAFIKHVTAKTSLSLREYSI
eukprot:1881964-Prymnesium_polylepis.1